PRRWRCSHRLSQPTPKTLPPLSHGKNALLRPTSLALNADALRHLPTIRIDRQEISASDSFASKLWIHPASAESSLATQEDLAATLIPMSPMTRWLGLKKSAKNGTSLVCSPAGYLALLQWNVQPLG